MITDTQIIEAVRAALPHNNLLDTVRLMVGALRDLHWEWLLRGSEVPFLGRFPIDLHMAVLIVVAIAVYVAVLATAAVILVASALLSDFVVQAAPTLAFIANVVHTVRGTLGR
jgi:hypothetical protein